MKTLKQIVSEYVMFGDRVEALADINALIRRAHAEGKAEGLRDALEIHQNLTLTRKETIARLCALIAPHLPAGEERPAAEEVKDG